MTAAALLGVELPIIQAPMAGVQDSELAVAVSNAGGLGSLPCAMLSAEDIGGELSKIRSGTSSPVNLNFFCHRQPVWNDAREFKWREMLHDYFTEFGIDIDAVPTGRGRQPFSHDIADAIEGFRPEIVSFHFGLPAPELLERVKKWGSTVLASATTVEEAVWLEAQGCNAIIAQGIEAGGHRGMFLTDDLSSQDNTRRLLQKIIAAVGVPVIAAGGIADAIGVAEVRGMGAIAAQVGTAYLLCPEAKTSPIHRASLMGPEAQHTAVTNVFTGRPARGIINRLIRECGPLCSEVPDFPLAANAISQLRSKAESNGSGDFTPLWGGMNAALCKEIPAAELTLELSFGN
jgi:nitronate monooxygenase